jgi:hypothetical protein
METTNEIDPHGPVVVERTVKVFETSAGPQSLRPADLPLSTAEPTSRWRAFVHFLLGPMLQIIMLGASGFVAWRVFNAWPVALADRVALPWLGLSFCLFPQLMGLLIAAMSVYRARSPPVGLYIPEGLQAPLDEKRRAEELWAAENERHNQLRGRTVHLASLLGMFATCAVGFCMIFILDAMERDIHVFSADVWPQRTALALTIGITVYAVFITSFGQLVMRMANNDGNTRMLASFMKATLHSVLLSLLLSATLICLTQDVGPDLAKLPCRPIGCLLIGIFVSLVGERATHVIVRLAGKVINLSVAPDATKNDAHLLPDLKKDDLLRLEEADGGSMYALAFTPTPRIFFMTRYPLQRICDWQNRAMLHALLGSDKAANLNKELAITGVVELANLAISLNAKDKPGSLPKGLNDKVAKAMSLSGEEQVWIVFQQLLSNPAVQLLRVFYHSCTKTSAVSR